MMTSPMPSACRWKRRRPASNFTSASSSTRSSTSRTPTSPCVPGRSSIACRAHRVSSSLKRTIEAPPTSAHTIRTTAVRRTARGGSRHWSGGRVSGIIVAAAAGPAHSVGGLRRGAARRRSASRFSFQSFSRPSDHEGEDEADEAEDRGAAEGREHPALRELDARVATGFEHGGAVDQIAERKQGAHGERERSEEHTSELQSLAYLVCRLLLEKKKTSNRRSAF